MSANFLIDTVQSGQIGRIDAFSREGVQGYGFVPDVELGLSEQIARALVYSTVLNPIVAVSHGDLMATVMAFRTPRLHDKFSFYFSQAVAFLRQNGYDVEVTGNPMTPESLEGERYYAAKRIELQEANKRPKRLSEMYPRTWSSLFGMLMRSDRKSYARERVLDELETLDYEDRRMAYAFIECAMWQGRYDHAYPVENKELKEVFGGLFSFHSFPFPKNVKRLERLLKIARTIGHKAGAYALDLPAASPEQKNVPYLMRAPIPNSIQQAKEMYSDELKLDDYDFETAYELCRRLIFNAEDGIRITYRGQNRDSNLTRVADATNVAFLNHPKLQIVLPKMMELLGYSIDWTRVHPDYRYNIRRVETIDIREEDLEVVKRISSDRETLIAHLEGIGFEKYIPQLKQMLYTQDLFARTAMRRELFDAMLKSASPETLAEVSAVLSVVGVFDRFMMSSFPVAPRDIYIENVRNYLHHLGIDVVVSSHISYANKKTSEVIYKEMAPLIEFLRYLAEIRS